MKILQRYTCEDILGFEDEIKYALTLFQSIASYMKIRDEEKFFVGFYTPEADNAF